MDNNRIKKAIKFATKKHEGQKRKFGGALYITHPSNVAEMVATYTNDVDMIMAAYLHDTIEDTNTLYNEILREFGKRVADLVNELTSDKIAYKKSNKADYLSKKMNKMSEEALLIKLCDRLDNVSCYPYEPDEFVKRYNEETEYILKNLKRKLNSFHIELIKKIRDILKEIQDQYKNVTNSSNIL
ncbi:MAG: HD domain-containing protein [Promethearchaeota archaeon]